MKPFIFGILLLFSVSLNAQIITTVAGNSGDGLIAKNAPINVMYGIAFDLAGNMYISDMDACTIRKVSAKTGIITTVIGSGIRGYSGDGGPAISATLNGPTNIVFDKDGNLYFADLFNLRIRKVSASTGVITTIAGNGINDSTGNNGLAISASIGYVYEMAIDSLGNIYLGDNNVRMINASTGIIKKIGNGRVSGIAHDGIHNLYTSDGSFIKKWDPITGNWITIFDIYPTRYYIDDLAIDKLGNLYFVTSGNSNGVQIGKVDLKTGNYTFVVGNGNPGFGGDDSLAILAKFSNCTELTVNKIGDLFIGDAGNHNIRKVTSSTGIINTVAGNGNFGGDGSSANSAFLYHPVDVEIDNAGNIFIADTDNNRIRKIDGTTSVISTIAGNGIAGFNGDNILATSASLKRPADIELDNLGNIFIADSDNNRIRKIEKLTGIITTVAGNGMSGYSGDGGPSTASKINSPLGICLDSVGNIYIADWSNHRIRKVNITTGIISTIAGTGIFGFSGDGNLATLAKINRPHSLAFDKIGDLYFSDGGNNRIRKISNSTSIITTFAGTGNSNFNGDSILASNANLYVADIKINLADDIYLNDNNRIRKINKSSSIITTLAGNGNFGYSGDGGLALLSSLQNPGGVAIDNNGTIYFVEAAGNRIRKVSNQLEFDFTSNTYFPQRPDTVLFSTSFKDSASYFEWSITPNTYEYLVGTNLNSAQPKVRFSKMGLYNIKLKVVYHGDTLTKNKLNYIAVSNPLLQNMDFNSNTNNATYLETVSFTVLFNDTPASIHWSFEPKTVVYLSGTDSSSLQPKLRFTQNGNYSVKLELSYLGDTLVKTKPNYITISSPLPPPLDFTTNNRTPQIFDTVYLKALFTDSIRFYQWSILPKLDYLYIQGTDSSSAQPKIKFTNFGKSYDVTLKIGFYNDTLSKIMLSYFYVTNKVGIAENIANDTYTIYPNPTHSNVLIETETPIENQLQCMVYDALGNLLNTHALSNLKTEITLPDPTGLYLIKILKPDGNFLLKKVIKEE